MRWPRLLLDTVFPPSCLACERPLPLGDPSTLCVPCLAAMLPPPPPLCTPCGAPLPADAPGRCPHCAERPPAFASARAVALYLPDTDGLNPLTVAVRRLKYEGRRPLADALGGLLAARYPFTPDALLVPVPLHVARLRERGFNQALLLARSLGRRRGLAVAPRALVRRQTTSAQPGLSAGQRRANVCGAFSVPRPDAVSGQHVVLVDDVLTSGATADACTLALLAAGAARVDVFTVGRVP